MIPCVRLLLPLYMHDGISNNGIFFFYSVLIKFLPGFGYSTIQSAFEKPQVLDDAALISFIIMPTFETVQKDGIEYVFRGEGNKLTLSLLLFPPTACSASSHGLATAASCRLSLAFPRHITGYS
jgi:hypothetical protein